MERRTTLGNIVVRLFSRIAVLLVFFLLFLNPGGISQAAEEKSLILLYTGEFRGQMMPLKG